MSVLQIVLRRTEVEEPVSQEIDIGSADGNPEIPDMLSVDHTHVDDEDYNTGGDIKVTVECNYPTGIKAPEPADYKPEVLTTRILTTNFLAMVRVY